MRFNCVKRPSLVSASLTYLKRSNVVNTHSRVGTCEDSSVECIRPYGVAHFKRVQYSVRRKTTKIENISCIQYGNSIIASKESCTFRSLMTRKCTNGFRKKKSSPPASTCSWTFSTFFESLENSNNLAKKK